MTPDLLREAGEALYGASWQAELARDLGVSDRTMRRWAAGTHPMPAGLDRNLLDICSKRQRGIGIVSMYLLHGSHPVSSG